MIIKPTPMTANVYTRFVFPIIRRIIPNLIVTDLVSVQPISDKDYKQVVKKRGKVK